MAESELTIEQFIADWPQSQQEVKTSFITLLDTVSTLPKTRLEFVARPGITYSLRACPESPKQGKNRPLFALIDVIDDPEGYFLSVCFYAEDITDPDELGDEIPEGLMGEDGYCFDPEEPEHLTYVQERIREAHQATA